MDFRGTLILAPLAGITDVTFRLLCRENGADVVVTEMASAKGLLTQPDRTRRFLAYREEERPVGAQIYGAVPAEIGAAGAEIRRMGFDFIDINMGCPVRKVVATGAGAALLANPRLAGEIVKAAVDGAGIPVTVKIRSGDGKDGEAYLRVAEEAYAAGAAAVTLHPRSRGQMFSGEADWGQIARLKREFPERVVIGNGDVRLPEDAGRMIAGTGCDAVMVGRAALGNPWIFAAIRQTAPSGGGPGTSFFPSPETRRSAILRHGREMFLRHGERGIVAMRKHLAWYSRGIPGASAFRAELVRVGGFEAFRTAVERFF